MAVVEEVRPAVPDVVNSRAVVAMVGVEAVQIGEEITMDCDAYCNIFAMNSRRWTECLFVMVVTLMIQTVRILDRDLAYEDWV